MLAMRLSAIGSARDGPAGRAGARAGALATAWRAGALTGAAFGTGGLRVVELVELPPLDRLVVIVCVGTAGLPVTARFAVGAAVDGAFRFATFAARSATAVVDSGRAGTGIALAAGAFDSGRGRRLIGCGQCCLVAATHVVGHVVVAKHHPCSVLSCLHESDPVSLMTCKFPRGIPSTLGVTFSASRDNGWWHCKLALIGWQSQSHPSTRSITTLPIAHQSTTRAA